MHEWLCQFLQQAAAVVVSARRWIMLSLPVIWLVTGLIFHFSRPWLCAVTTGTSMGMLLMVCRILNTWRGMVGSLIALWVGTELLFHFSRPWLCAVTTGMSMGLLFIACRILNTRKRPTRALSLKLHQLGCAMKQREDQAERAMKKRHRGQHNEGNGWHDRSF